MYGLVCWWVGTVVVGETRTRGTKGKFFPSRREKNSTTLNFLNHPHHLSRMKRKCPDIAQKRPNNPPHVAATTNGRNGSSALSCLPACLAAALQPIRVNQTRFKLSRGEGEGFKNWGDRCFIFQLAWSPATYLGTYSLLDAVSHIVQVFYDVYDLPSRLLVMCLEAATARNIDSNFVSPNHLVLDSAETV